MLMNGHNQNAAKTNSQVLCLIQIHLYVIFVVVHWVCDTTSLQQKISDNPERNVAPVPSDFTCRPAAGSSRHQQHHRHHTTSVLRICRQLPLLLQPSATMTQMSAIHAHTQSSPKMPKGTLMLLLTRAATATTGGAVAIQTDRRHFNPAVVV